jgi:hypothetical protein
MTRIGGYAHREPGSLKEAQQALVEAVGGLDRAVDVLGGRIGRSQLGRYTSDTEEHHLTNMPIDIVAALEAKCGDLIVTRWLAAHGRALLLQLPEGAPAPFVRELCTIGKETGAFFGAANEALADGSMTAKEAGKVKRACIRIAAGLGAMLSRLDCVIDSGKAST